MAFSIHDLPVSKLNKTILGVRFVNVVIYKIVFLTEGKLFSASYPIGTDSQSCNSIIS